MLVNEELIDDRIKIMIVAELPSRGARRTYST
jgi:hypothetical protein